jgi:23S rRNA pseudouridine1911/1915/1917 synthase
LKNPKILYEDNHLLAVFKPAGISIQADKSGDADLLNGLKAFLKKRDQKPGRVYLGLVHRLDRPVSGVVVFAKTSKAAGRLSEQFRTGQVEKKYLALVAGRELPEQGELTGYLRSTPENKSRISLATKAGSKPVALRYDRLSHRHPAFPDATFLWVYPKTGRKHQIRAQLAQFGHPIVGDHKYGSRIRLQPGRIALLAQEIRISHPVTKERLTLAIAISPEWPMAEATNHRAVR